MGRVMCSIWWSEFIQRYLVRGLTFGAIK